MKVTISSTTFASKNHPHGKIQELFFLVSSVSMIHLPECNLKTKTVLQYLELGLKYIYILAGCNCCWLKNITL